MLFATAFLFGLTLALAVGPVALIILGAAAAHGTVVGLRAGLGAALADLAYAAAALAVGGWVAPALIAHDTALRTAAALVLTLFGLWMVRGALKPAPASTPEAPAAQPGLARRPTATLFLLTIVNPLTIVLFLGFTAHLPPDADGIGIAAATLAVFLGSLVGQSLFALGGAGLGRLLRDGPWIGRLNLFSGVAVTLFGVAGLLH